MMKQPLSDGGQGLRDHFRDIHLTASMSAASLASLAGAVVSAGGQATRSLVREGRGVEFSRRIL